MLYQNLIFKFKRKSFRSFLHIKKNQTNKHELNDNSKNLRFCKKIQFKRKYKTLKKTASKLISNTFGIAPYLIVYFAIIFLVKIDKIKKYT